MAAPKVFISYSHDSPEHAGRVLALSDRLRRDGIDSDIDQYEMSPADGWPRWMVNKVEWADFVLVVCTETYQQRFRGAGQGKGVKWEGAILTQKLYDDEAHNSMLIPVGFGLHNTDHIPVILKGQPYYDVNATKGYEALYRRLTHQPYVVKPPLGPLQQLPPKKPKDDLWQETKRLPSATVVETPRRDKAVIYGFNINDLVNGFLESLDDDKEVSGFSVGGPDYDMIKNYFIERLVNEYVSRRQCQIKPKSIDVVININDISDNENVLKNKLDNRLCSSVQEWFCSHPLQDMIVIFWNYSVPEEDIKAAAFEFWDYALKEVSPFLQEDRDQCFVVIWANVGIPPIELNLSGFTVLKSPEQFEIKSLVKWFRKKWNESGIDKDQVDRYLDRLKSQHGFLLETYREMKNIMQMIQGDIVSYD